MSGGRRTAPAGGGDPLELSEEAGFGFFQMEGPADFVAGGSGHTGDLYQWLDKTASQHVGTLTHRSGSASTSLPVANAGEAGFFRSTSGTGERLWLNSPPVNNVLVFVMAFRWAANALTASRYLISHKESFAARPFVRLDLGAFPLGQWGITVGQNGTDVISDADGQTFTIDPRDGNWHVAAVHWGSAPASGGEGIIFDLDGYPLLFPDIDEGNGPIAFNSFFSLDLNNQAGTSYTAPFDHDIGALAWGKNKDTITHAQTRAVAAALMERYGVTNLG